MEREEGDHVYTVAQHVGMETADGTYILQQDQGTGTTVYLDGGRLDNNVIISNNGDEEVVYIVQSKVVEMSDGTYAIVEDEGVEDTIAGTVTEQGAAFQGITEISEHHEGIPGTQQPTFYIEEEHSSQNPVIASSSHVPDTSSIVAVTLCEPGDDSSQTVLAENFDTGGVEIDTDEGQVNFVLCCQYCGACFEDVEQLKIHLLEDHDHEEEEEEEIEMKDNVEGESLNEAFRKFSTCQNCNETYLDEKDLASHLEQCTGPTGNETSRQDMLSKAEIVPKKEGRKHHLLHKCQECDMAFTVRSDLDKHIEEGVHIYKEESIEPSAKLPYVKCPYCERLFLERWLKKSLFRHIKAEHPGLPSEVPVERVEVQNKSRLKAVKVDNKEDAFPCGLCDKIFIWKKSLLRHVKTYHEEFQYMTSVEIAEKFGLYFSTRRNKVQLPMQCFFCDAVFQTMREINTHMVDWHSGEDFGRRFKPLYKCPSCSLISKYSHCIKKHISLKHKSEYSQEDIETMALPTVDPLLYADEVKVLDKRPYDEKYKESLYRYQCPLCEYATTNSSNMYRHLRSKRHEDDYTEGLLKDIEKLKVVQNSDEQYTGKGVSRASQTRMAELEITHQEGMESADIDNGSSISRVVSSAWKTKTTVGVGEEMKTIREATSEDKNESALADDILGWEGIDDSAELFIRECVVCKEPFDRVSAMIEHSRNHVNIMLMYKCSICGIVFPKIESLQKHLSAKHKTCKVTALMEWLEIDSVEMKDKPLTTYDCPYCELVVSQERVLSQHIFQAHSHIVNKTSIKQEPSTMSPQTSRAGPVQSIVAGLPCLHCMCVYGTVTDIVKHMAVFHYGKTDKVSETTPGSVRKSSRKRKAKDFGDDFESEVTPVKSADMETHFQDEDSTTLLELPTPTRKRKRREPNAGNAAKQDLPGLTVDDLHLNDGKTTDDQSLDGGVALIQDSSTVEPAMDTVLSESAGTQDKCVQEKQKTRGRRRKPAKRTVQKGSSGTTAKSKPIDSEEEKPASCTALTQSLNEGSTTGTKRRKKHQQLADILLNVTDTMATNKCPHCEFTCKRSSALTFHINFNHPNIKEEVIDPGYKEASARGGLQPAMTQEFDEELDADDDEEYVPDNAEVIEDGEAEFHCPFCEDCTSLEMGVVEKHVKSIHMEQASSLSTVVLTRKVVTASKLSKTTLTCIYCKKQFRSQYEIERHIGERHKNLRMENTRNVTDGMRSMASEQQERICYKCSYCDSLFSSIIGVKWHVDQRHPECMPVQDEQVQISVSRPGVRFVSLYSCPFCCTWSNQPRKSVLRHIRSAHKDKFHSFSIADIPCELTQTRGHNSMTDEQFKGDKESRLGENVKVEDVTGEINDSVFFGEITDDKLPADGVETRYLCPYCDFSSTWKKATVTHVKGLHPDLLDSFHADLIKCETMTKRAKVPEKGHFTCPYCNVVHKWKKSLVRHLRTNHPDLPQVVNFTSSQSNGDENIQESEFGFKDRIRKTFSCLKCNFNSRSKTTMSAHFSQEHAEFGPMDGSHYRCVYEASRDKGGAGLYPCPKCGARYLWKKSVHLHMKTHHPEDLEVFTLLDKLVDVVHLQVPRSNIRHCHNCPKCRLVLPNAALLQAHLRRKHSLIGNRTTAKLLGRKCFRCHLYFPTCVALLRHRALTHNATAVQCRVCGRRFQTSRECLLHEKIRHPSTTGQCPYPECHVRRSLKTLLESHMKVHHTHSESLSRCEVCSSVFQDVEDLKHHLLAVHASVDMRTYTQRKDRVFRCSLCQQMFPSIRERDHHVAEAHPDGAFMCELCAARFPAARLLALHMKTHNVIDGCMKRIQCPDCGKSLYSKNLKKHIYFRHPQTMSCDCHVCNSPYDGKHMIACRTCSKQFCTKIMLFGHNRIHHARSGPLYSFKASQSGTKHRCLFCQEMFRTQRERNMHMHESHKAERQRVAREQYTLPSVSDHLNSVEGMDSDNTHVIQIGQNQGKQYLPKLSDTSFGAVIKELVYVMPKNSTLPYKCLLCGRCFAKSKYIRLHIRRAHVKDEDQPYRCKVCGSGFVRLTEFRKHSRAHSGFRPYKCTKCTKAFKQQANLMEHMFVHEEVKSFKCVICSRTFRQRGALNAHLNCHDTLKPFKCMFCKKGFTTRGELSRHMQKYDLEESKNGEKNFLCHICEQTFNHYPLLLKHIEEHNPEKPFICGVCSQRFGSYNSLYSHKLKNEHFLESEIETESIEWSSRKRKVKKHSSNEDVERAVSSLENGDTQMYMEEISSGEQILICQPDGSYILEETIPKSIEVVVNGLENAEMYVTEENTEKSENEELLSIAKQLTELSSYTEAAEVEAGHMMGHEDDQSVEAAQLMKAEDEIIKDMLEADAVLLANMDRHSAGRRWLYDVEAEKTPLLRETLLKISNPPPTEIDQEVETDEHNEEVGEESVSLSSVVLTDHNATYSASMTDQLPSNMAELAAMIPSLSQNESVTAYQSEDGTMIFLCVAEQPMEEVVKSDTVVEDDRHEYAENQVEGLPFDAEMRKDIPLDSNNCMDVMTETVVEASNEADPHSEEGGYRRINNVGTHNQQVRFIEQNVVEETSEQTEETLSEAAFEAENVKILETAVGQLVNNINVEVIETKTDQAKEEAYEESLVEYENDEQTFIKEEILNENFAKSIGESRIFTYRGQDFRYRYIVEQKRLQCLECDYLVTTPKYLKLHMYRHLSQQNRRCACHICMKRFVTNSELRRHMTIHTDERNYKCHICPKAFRQIGHLKDHVKTHTRDKMFKCNHCDAQFVTRSNLVVHRKRNHDANREMFRCEECGATFMNKDGLKKHIGVQHTALFDGSSTRRRKNSDQSKLMCETCGLTFTSKKYLSLHMRSHGKCEVVCDVCGAGFMQQDSLNEHKAKFHAKEKKHMCEYCGQTFNTAQQLSSHRLKHKKLTKAVPKKKWDCKVCGKQFSAKSSLAYHGGVSERCRLGNVAQSSVNVP